ncbi:MAG TPA: DUF4438 domain-containing protein [Patescibacteria group bacterium]|nr:DUF4438 domain-containing protein [Patescibacteria group bacterium]
MLKTNRERLVMQSVMGEIAHPRMANPYKVGHDGIPRILPGIGAITYNVGIGDSAFAWECDHVEPGVSIRHKDDTENTTMITLACIGNEARVVSGDGKGSKGFVTGTHGGRDNTIVYFDKTELDAFAIGDKIQIKAWGLGLKLTDYPDIAVMSLDPDLLDAMDVREIADGIDVPVVTQVPAYLMGSGIGANTAYKGDYDIMTQDPEAVKEFGLDKLRFGDLVLLRDCDNTYGRAYLKGAVTVGVVVHSNCILSGHGPGIMTLLSCKTDRIRPRIDSKANIGYYKNVLK